MKKLTKALTCAGMAAIMTVSSGMCAVTASADWHKTSNGYYYTDSDGDRLTGWQTIGSGKYYFNSKGYAATGFKTVSGKKYYFSSAKKGRMATGWLKVSGEKYYFGTDGVMRTGWKKIGGKTYYFGKDGKMRTGTVKIDGEVCKFDDNGVLKSKGNSSSSTSSGGFASKPLGKSKWGTSPSSFLKNNGIEDYTVEKGDDDLKYYMFYSENYLGESSVVVAMFNKSKLVGVVAIAEDGAFSSTTEKKLEKAYGDSIYSGSDGSLWVTDDEMVLIMDYDGVNVFVAVSNDYVEEYGDVDIDDYIDNL